jgi:hypothetical protein
LPAAVASPSATIAGPFVAGSPGFAGSLAPLQRLAGNRAVAELVGRRPVQRVSITVQRAVTQADQEAEATETLDRLRRIHREMLRSSNRTVRNTAGLFTRRRGQPPRLAYEPMTLRSDSSALVRAAGGDPATDAYYFYGTTQDNQHKFGPNTIGTVRDHRVILVRGRTSSGWQDDEAITGTFTHEASHLLVSAYGEHPATDTSASSFDRYKDEFRAYWIEPVGRWAEIRDPDEKARRIKRHMVGSSAGDTTGYARLRTRYWNPAEAAFKALVDAHTRPDGYNLTNSPDQDRLFQILQGIPGGTATVDDAVLLATRMSPLDRREASLSPLIRRLYRALPAEDGARIRGALAFPQTAPHARELNPDRSRRVQAFLEAIALRDELAIETRYRRMSAGERSQMAHNAALLVFVDRNVDWGRLRAMIVAMAMSGRADQFQAMGDFLDACLGAQVIAAVEGSMTAVPDDVQAALDRLVYTARLALYRLTEDVRREYVDPLPDPVRRRLLYALREEGEI